MQLHEFYDLKKPRDLLHKLEREYERWKADSLNVDLAWNFFVTAEHLPDWIYYQDKPTSGKTRPDLLDGKERRPFKQAYPWTRICSHLANGGKHFHLVDPHLDAVASTRQRPRAFYEPGAFFEDEEFFESSALMVDLMPAEKQALSLAEASIKALDLAYAVLKFWRARMP